jgi:CubicO group peptidase (beta-lactamase class C family)
LLVTPHNIRVARAADKSFVVLKAGESSRARLVSREPAVLSGAPSRREVVFGVAGTALAAMLPIGEAVASPRVPFARRVEQLDATLRSRHFSGSVLVAERGEILLEKGYGLADRAQGRANVAGTLFDIGSVTKQFVAAAILHLEERGLLRTEDPLSKYLEVPANKRGITLGHLLMHRSGLGYPRGDGGDGGDGGEPKKYFETFLREAPLSSPPGTRFFYNNVGYNLLAYVVEKVSGERFEDYLRAHLFLPVGMSSTGFNEPGSIDPARAARGYEGRRGYLSAGRLPNNWGYRGATGVISSVGDLYRWTAALNGDGILSAASKKKLFTPGPGRDRYAMGWSVELGAGGMPVRASHDGATMGFVSKLIMKLESGRTIIAASNDYQSGGVLLPLFDNLAAR